MDSESTPGSAPNPTSAAGADVACATRLSSALVELVSIAALPVTNAMRLRLALRPVVRDARAEGLRPEQFIVLVKHAWSMQPGLSSQDPVRHRALHDKLITACISEYFAPDSSA